MKLEAKNPSAKWRGDLEDTLGYDHIEWRKRIVALSDYITSDDKSVMDLGAGNMHLRRILNKKVKYYPVDYKKTADDTIVCDFNKKEFPELDVDVIVAAGILNYIEDPEWFLDTITKHCRKLLISYKGLEKYEYSAFYSAEIIAYLNEKGFGITGMVHDFDEWTILGCFEKISAVNLGNQISCTGCGSCYSSCSVDAILMDYDKTGYLKPGVDLSKCIGCNKCVLSCPELHKNKDNDKYENPKCYAAKANDEVVLNSTSGGFFSVLSSQIISKGGIVFGAVWDEEFHCKIVGAEKEDELAPMRFSKYTQANTAKSFIDVAKELLKGRLVAYFGCPCQIAGLKGFLRNQNITFSQDNLITVDLVCFCAPSNVYFRKYLEENYGIVNIKNVTFRDKKRGWSPFGYKIELKTGEVLYPQYSEDRYQQAFHEVLARNDVCENCKYHRIPRQGDFTIGDFWGIENYDISWCDDKGTSIVLVNTKKADVIFEEIKDAFIRCEEVPIEYSSNRINDSARPGHPNRHYYNSLVSTKTFNDAVDNAKQGKHDIGLVCLANLNTGNNLTNYALYQTITDMGYRVLVIGEPVDKNSYRGVDNRFIRFLKLPYDRYDIASISFEKSDLYQYNDMCDIFLVGSDQLFRSIFVEEMDNYSLLDWVSGEKYKISYSTSFGCDVFEGSKSFKLKMAYLLGRFQKVSVREKSSITLLQDSFNVNGTCVLDPVFLCNKDYYEKMVKVGRIRMPSDTFVGAYILDKDETKYTAIKKIAELLCDDRYVVLNDFYDDGNMLKEPAIEEWVAMIADCDFFVTDSFHGVCFAMIFEKEFAVIFDKNNWRGYERIRDILSLVGLENRYLDDSADKDRIQELIDDKIDYIRVNSILSREKYNSYRWLKTALNEGKDFVGVYDSQDMLIEIKKDEKVIENRINELNDFLIRTRSDLFLQSRNEIIFNRERNLRKKMTIVGFGAGDCFRRNLESIKRIYNIHYICDNNPEKWGKELAEGVTCISPKQLSEMADVLVVIMVDSVKMSFEIVDELTKMGITNFTHIENWLSSLQ